MSHTRRSFLQHVSAATAAGMLTQIPMRRLLATPLSQLIPAPDEVFLKECALKAMDAARAAGATFADIRITAARYVSVGCGWSRRGGDAPGMSAPSIGFPTRYGIRAIVDGAWGFAGGSELMPDAIVETARTAVGVARGNKPRRPRTLDLAPMPVVKNGMWATPVAQEPLDVPLGEQGELQLEAITEAIKVPETTWSQTGFQWRRPTVVFATTEGASVVQRFAFAAPSAIIGVAVGEDIWSEATGSAEGMLSGGYGYEAIKGRLIVTALREGAEKAVALAKEARKATSVDVGRYDLVFDNDAVVSLLNNTLAGAVNAEYALGYLANGAGISFAAPPSDILGKYRAATAAITVRGDRTRANGAATTGWDDEGVKPEEYTFVKDGVIIDYHTSRETAPQLGDWYKQRGEPVRAHGVMRQSGSNRPSVFLPNLTLDPGTGATKVDDLIAGTKKGLYVQDGGGGADQQMLNAQFYAGHTSVRQITNGKLGGYVKDVAFQFITTPFWKSLDGIGGKGSGKAAPTITDYGAWFDPLQPFPMSTIEVVPLRARQVNVLNTGRTA